MDATPTCSIYPVLIRTAPGLTKPLPHASQMPLGEQPLQHEWAHPVASASVGWIFHARNLPAESGGERTIHSESSRLNTEENPEESPGPWCIAHWEAWERV